MPATVTKHLDRQLGFPSVFAIALGAMMGSGLFVLPGLAAIQAGPWVSLSYLLAGLLVLPAVFSKAELATAMPVSGGTYVYIDRSMGPLAGTIAGLGTWFSLTSKTAFAVVGLGSYLVLFSPDINPLPVALVVVVTLLVVNVVGVGKASKLQVAIVVGTVACLLVLSSAGIATADLDLQKPAFPHGVMGIVSAAGFVFVSYSGVTKICSVAEEVRKPEWNIPFGMLAAQAAVMGLYTLVAWVLTANVPLEQIEADHDITPVATMAQAVFGDTGHSVFALVAVLGLTSMCNAGILSSSRFPFAMARDGLLPAQLERVSARFGTPLLAIAVTGVLLITLVTALPVVTLAKVASGFKIFIFALVNLSVIVLRESHASWYRPRFLSPLYPFTQIVGIAGGVALLISLGKPAFIGVSAALVLGAGWYLIYGRRQVDRSSVLSLLRGQQYVIHETERYERAEAGLHDEPSRVLVPVFGGEPAPERLLWLAAAFVDEGKLDVLRLEEVPDQTALGMWLKADPLAEELAEESLRIAEDLHLDVEFHDIVTRNANERLHDHAVATNADWIVVAAPQWKGLHRLVRHPWAFWMDNPFCDLALFLDRRPDDGPGGFERILMMPRPGPWDSLVVHVAERMARFRPGARVTLLSVMPPGAVEERELYHQQVGALFGCMPWTSRVIESTDVLGTIEEVSGEYDLLIIEAQREGRFIAMFRHAMAHRIADAARCSVLKVKAPRHKVHHRLPAPPEDTEEVLALAPHLDRAVIHLDLEVERQSLLFKEMARSLAEELRVTSEEVEGALWARERRQPTAIPRLVALAEATVPGACRTLVGLFTLRTPVVYMSSGNPRVDVVVAVVSPPGERQLQLGLLDRLSQVVRTDAVRDVREATDAESVRRAVLRGWERLVAERMAQLPKKVLLVDDEEEYVQTLSERLRARDVQAVVAHDGEEALSLVELDAPEVMVLDLKMPGVHGLQVLARVKEVHPATEVIILTTAQGTEAEHREAERLGAFAFLTKPIDIDQLARAIKEAHAKVAQDR